MGFMMMMKKGIEEEEQEQNIQENIVDLSSDSVYEILTRVSLDTLFRRCRWVCKDWQRLVYDTKFKIIHAQRTQTISGYFIQSSERCRNRVSFVSIIDHSPKIPSPSLDFLPRNTKIEASSLYGLICCVNNTENIRIPTYYICKPATREWRKIPNPRTGFFTEKMAILVIQSHPTLHYKILRFSKPKTALGYHCEIFDSNNWAWKRLEDIKLPPNVILKPGCGIFANGGFHWLTDDDHVFVFYVDQENWTTIELPQERLGFCKKLVQCEGKIGVFYTTDEWLELWVLEDHCRNQFWKKKYKVDLRSLHRDTNYSSLLDMYSSDTLLMTSYDEIIWYNCNNNVYAAGKLQEVPSVSQVYAFQSDLAPCSFR
ncbi:F-box associated domain [Macleaya cordata]|uniref:F-box associated domain n=1 Tax=Macleaya cordata TaxID=56857 RepID=A0A200PNA2_MACCD|nr:F-box associated domain [Macleaya cordata]